MAEEVVVMVVDIVVEEDHFMAEIVGETMARMEEESAEEKQYSSWYCSL